MRDPARLLRHVPWLSPLQAHMRDPARLREQLIIGTLYREMQKVCGAARGRARGRDRVGVAWGWACVGVGVGVG